MNIQAMFNKRDTMWKEVQSGKLTVWFTDNSVEYFNSILDFRNWYEKNTGNYGRYFVEAYPMFSQLQWENAKISVWCESCRNWFFNKDIHRCLK